MEQYVIGTTKLLDSIK